MKNFLLRIASGKLYEAKKEKCDYYFSGKVFSILVINLVTACLKYVDHCVNHNCHRHRHRDDTTNDILIRSEFSHSIERELNEMR